MSRELTTPEPTATDHPLALQDVVLRLQHFWAARQCLLLPPCDFGVPYATLQPDAFFRTLGPEPWRAAYLQPVRRPLDSRLGRHPYRLSRHLQLQVMLKPPPADVQTLYVESLEALSVDLALHDLRFEEWRWQPRSLGVRGSGWHVLLDGLGVTRLTFLERVADREIDPVSVEISYGLERLSMLLQGAEDAFSVRWSDDGPEYGSLRRRDEMEQSRYFVEVAHAGDLRQRLEALGREAQRCLEAGLARPAYEIAVRCLGPIDTLDARGELSARERASWLDRVHEQVVAAADLYLSEEAKLAVAAGKQAAPVAAKAGPPPAAAKAEPPPEAAKAGPAAAERATVEPEARKEKAAASAPRARRRTKRPKRRKRKPKDDPEDGSA